MRATNAASSVLTPVITAGYNENRYPSPRGTPPGQYVGVYPHTVPPPNPPPVVPKPMEGACAYWDGLWDRDHGGNATSGTNTPGDPDDPATYRADLVLNGSVRSSLAFVKTA